MTTDPLDLVERLDQACDRLSDFTHGDVREAINDARSELTRLRAIEKAARVFVGPPASSSGPNALYDLRAALREKGAEK